MGLGHFGKVTLNFHSNSSALSGVIGFLSIPGLTLFIQIFQKNIHLDCQIYLDSIEQSSLL